MGKGRILLIAGSDSSGGAGLEADQRVAAVHGCYAMTATTALTAQNTVGVNAINYTPPDFVRKQIDACISDIGVDVVKTGMLASAEAIGVVADTLQKYNVLVTVVDPVMVSTSGAQLLPKGAVVQLRKLLLPMTTILTPNVPEAKLLLSDAGQIIKEPSSVEDLVLIAKAVQALGPKYVLVKGGHLPFKNDGDVASEEIDKELVVDVLYGNGNAICINSPYQKSRNTHGTGCSLASAIACNLANGADIPTAVRAACKYIEAGIKLAPGFGQGNGPINHFHSTYTLPFSPGHFLEFMLDRADVRKAWSAYTEHEFVARLADGTLSIAAFKNYLIQDYLFLIQFARANALAAYKAKGIEDISASAKIVSHISHEMNLHINYCKGFGITKNEMETAKESEACTAYTRYVLDVGQAEDFFALQVAMAPCLIGYGAIARRLYDDPKTKRGNNTYWMWIENYVADDYTESVKLGSALLERHAILQSPSRIEELVKIFIHATSMETGFWNLGVPSN